MHNPNPFDFVSFTDGPFVNTPDGYDALGDLLSGYLEFELTALTPVHIVGYQQQDLGAGHSFMYRNQGHPCLPAASIRGCVRAFIEALTAGWVSQATEEYPKAYRQRHVGFKTFETYTAPRRGSKSPPAVDPKFKPQMHGNGEIDLASYLFGTVIEQDNGQHRQHATAARKSKVWIEDAFINQNDLEHARYWVPDIAGNAFMGGAKPSASNWWYFEPHEIWDRHTNGRHVAEFVGRYFWGRKFYYHQDPIRCIRYYDPRLQRRDDEPRWDYGNREFYPVHIECLERDRTTLPFRVYLHQVPTSLVVLLAKVFVPGNIRHKLGYGKAYGYGSVSFAITGAQLRHEPHAAHLPGPLQDWAVQVKSWCATPWNQQQLAQYQLDTLIDWEAIRDLATILGWQGADQLLFTYPQFAKGGFATPIAFRELENRIANGRRLPQHIPVTYKQGWDIAEILFDLKQPIHFRQYQESAEGWTIIESRTP